MEGAPELPVGEEGSRLNKVSSTPQGSDLMICSPCVSAGIPQTAVISASFDDAVAITGFAIFSHLAIKEPGNEAWTIAQGPLQVRQARLPGSWQSARLLVWLPRCSCCPVTWHTAAAVLQRLGFNGPAIVRRLGSGRLPRMILAPAVSYALCCAVELAAGQPACMTRGTGQSSAHIVTPRRSCPSRTSKPLAGIPKWILCRFVGHYVGS
jgi:hypothetical protein